MSTSDLARTRVDAQRRLRWQRQAEQLSRTPRLVFEMPGIQADPANIWIVIRQVMPGVRVRAIVTAYSEPPDVETLGHALLDILVEHVSKGSAWGTPISRSVIYQRAMAMAQPGQA